MAGRVPFQSPAKLYPPFLPPPISVDPFKADSFIIVGVVQPEEGSSTPELVPHPVFGEQTPIIEEVPPNRLPPPPGMIDPAVRPAAIGDMPFSGGVHGDIAVKGAHGWTFLAAGTVGQILKTNGDGAAPSWQDA